MHPTCAATAMCAKLLSCSSHASHFLILGLSPDSAINTFWLCQ